MATILKQSNDYSENSCFYPKDKAGVFKSPAKVNVRSKEMESNEGKITLSSAKSMEISLEKVRQGKAGLNSHREALLSRVSKANKNHCI